MSSTKVNPQAQPTLSDRAKHRLRIAARFLRRNGHRFRTKEFYTEVLTTIFNLQSDRQRHLQELVDWVEEYEITERTIFGDVPKSPRSRASNSKEKQVFKNARMRASVSDTDME